MQIGERVYRVESCSSTNDLAREMARRGEPEGTAIVSEEQSKGRGTRGRSWFSAKNLGLYLSIILRPGRLRASLLPLLGGLATSEAIFETLGIRTGLKWPNDIVWGRRKLGGILCESEFTGNRLDYTILGIGVNLNHRREDFPDEIRDKAVSLRMISGGTVESLSLLSSLWIRLNHWYNILLRGKEKEIVASYEEKLIHPKGATLILSTEEGERSGTFQGIDLEGRLIVESEGRRFHFIAGEIHSFREA